MTYDLDRFVRAQDMLVPGGLSAFDQAMAELHAGRKRTHWMWFVFPQAAGLSTSFMGRRYAIHSLGEAVAYLSHRVLGPRLVVAYSALQHEDADAILGVLDATKFRSSLDLFSRAAAAVSYTPYMATTQSSEGSE